MYGLGEFGICLDEAFYGTASVDHGGVVAVAEIFAYCGEAVFGEFLAEVHGDLPCYDNLTFLGILLEGVVVDLEVVAHGIYDCLLGYSLVFGS